MRGNQRYAVLIQSERGDLGGGQTVVLIERDKPGRRDPDRACSVITSP